MRTKIHSPHPDKVLAALAARQHGVVAHRQLIEHGLTPSLVNRRVASGHLVPVHRRVYAVGHAQLRREGHWLAAVLACGPGAALSHRDAAALHGIRYSNGARVEVSTAAQRRSTAKIRVHGRSILDARDTTTVDGIPVTTVARTLVDLAGVISSDGLAKALSEAERSGTLDVRAIDSALHRMRGRRGPGHAHLRAALEAHAALGVTLTRSELEQRFLVLLDAHRIPRPRMNAWIHELRIEADALWSAQRLVVELDGYGSHSSRRAFQRDRDRANVLTAAGYTVLRFTHRDVVRDGQAAAARVAQLLGAQPSA